MKELIELYRTKQRAEHPDFPEAYLPKKKFTDRTANGLTQAVITFLNLSGHFAERVSSSGRMIDNRQITTNAVGQKTMIGSTKWIPGSMTKGTADISCTMKRPSDGQIISWKVEIKIGKDRMSEAQHEYKRKVEAAGAVYTVVHNFQEFKDEYAKLMACKQD